MMIKVEPGNYDILGSMYLMDFLEFLKTQGLLKEDVDHVAIVETYIKDKCMLIVKDMLEGCKK